MIPIRACGVTYGSVMKDIRFAVSSVQKKHATISASAVMGVNDILRIGGDKVKFEWFPWICFTIVLYSSIKLFMLSPVDMIILLVCAIVVGGVMLLSGKG